MYPCVFRGDACQTVLRHAILTIKRATDSACIKRESRFRSKSLIAEAGGFKVVMRSGY
ncbi:hypothetical protein MBAV_003465 [Candidatus Magnetobacterium bavaricum]|uniref:Uncharacterized protein n=1 Tax=Candidatus Magnetobacterium bavaricum TaxID=29290 RepID=A0A0F3GR09_9BACT|nr:hypothetical protein MBAV_003465 [Candidatus Magnetobacterium bavaricum]